MPSLSLQVTDSLAPELDACIFPPFTGKHLLPIPFIAAIASRHILIKHEFLLITIGGVLDCHSRQPEANRHCGLASSLTHVHSQQHVRERRGTAVLRTHLTNRLRIGHVQQRGSTQNLTGRCTSILQVKPDDAGRLQEPVYRRHPAILRKKYGVPGSGRASSLSDSHMPRDSTNHALSFLLADRQRPVLHK